jgi:hypothetical protein
LECILIASLQQWIQSMFAPKSLDATQVVNGGRTNSMDLVYPFRLCVILLMARLGKP